MFGQTTIIYPYFYAMAPDEELRLLMYRRVFRLAASLSAIDPIAVVTVVDDLQISRHMTVLLKIESLLSQTMATLLDNLLADVDVPHFDISEFLTARIKDVIGVAACVLLGYIYARMLGWLLRSILYVDYVASIGVTFAMVYISYATGMVCIRSGILCLVIFAIVLNTRRGLISRRIYDDIRYFWNVVAYCSYCIGVAFMGRFMGAYVLTIRHRRYYYGLFPIAIFARFCSIIIMTPALRLVGGFELESSMIAVIGGIRGFVRALIITPILMKTDASQRTYYDSLEHQLLFSIGVAGVYVGVFSHQVQSMFAKPLVKRLGLQSSSGLQRVNSIIKDKIAAKKQLTENRDVMWDLIESEISFNFTTTSSNEESANSQKGFWLRECGRQQGPGKCVSEAADNHCAVDIDKLFNDLQQRGQTWGFSFLGFFVGILGHCVGFMALFVGRN